jgi:hypothetical protein
MRQSFVPSIVPNGKDQTEDRSDPETTISDLISGQYDNPVRVIAFNAAERWSEDVPEEIAREIMRRVGLAGDELPSSLLFDHLVGGDKQRLWRGQTRLRVHRTLGGGQDGWRLRIGKRRL